MKKILICGARSYIGTSFESYILCFPSDYRVSTLDMTDRSWQNSDFSGYNTVIYVAGIAHINPMKLSRSKKEEYWYVNAQLPIEAAKKAKRAGISQFIFLSSMSIYGKQGRTEVLCMIDKSTAPEPKDLYGDSKLSAETGILPLDSEDFHICILRPPMIYGKDSRGNYPQLSKLAQMLPFFPNFENQRSMLYIENLCALIKLLIDNHDKGYFWPQNAEFVNTSKLVYLIAKAHNHSIRMVDFFNIILVLFSRMSLVRKLFGNLIYAKELSVYQNGNYNIVDFEESVIKSERL